MRTGMLGNNETLRRLWGGPLLDLAVKLNGEEGPELEEALKGLLRKEIPWKVKQSGAADHVSNLGQVVPSPGFPLFSTFNVQAFLAHWVKFYQDVYEITLDQGQVLMPSVDKALGAGVVMLPGITIEQDLSQIQKRTEGNFLYRYTNQNLDEHIYKNKEPPRPKGAYAVWTAPAVEATDQAPNLDEKSYLDIQKLGVPVMIFKEYTRFFLWHLWTTGQPLDQKVITLSCSLGADGRVLYGDWFGGRFCVSWYNQPGSDGRLRARQVVLPPLA